MKLKTSDLINDNNMLSHLILSCMNELANQKVLSIEDKDTDYEISLTFEGIELDITKFSKMLEKQFDDIVKSKAIPLANKLFDKMQHEYKSKNSKAMKLQKIKEQFDKVNNQLLNIQKDIQMIDIN
jgi:hypothetical protein